MSNIDHELFGGLIKRLRLEGHDTFARKFEVLLYETCWTSSSEMIGELGLALIAFQRGKPSMSPALQRLLERCMEVVARTWPGIR
jgi:hypothetical protein